MELLRDLKSTNPNKLLPRIADFSLAALLSFTLIYSVRVSLHLEFKINQLFQGGIKGGIVLIWNKVADYLGSTKYILLNNYAGEGKTYGLAMMFIFALVMAISYFVVKSRNKWLLSPYLIIPCMPVIVAGTGPNLWGLILIITVVSGVRYVFFLEKTNLKDLIILASAFVLISAAIAGAGFVSESYLGDKVKDKIRNTGKAVESFGEEVIYGKLRPADDEVAFRIKMENPQQMWLKSKVGEVYSEGKWKDNPSFVQYKYLKEKEILSAGGHNPLSQLNHVLETVGEESDRNKINIQYDKASKKYFLHPYEYVGENPKGSKTYGDSYITKESLIPDKNIEFVSAKEQTSRWTELLGRLYSRDDGGNYRAYKNFEYTTNKWAYTRFLDVDPRIAINLRGEIGDPGNQEKEHVDYRYAVDKIMSYMKDKVVYSKAAEKRKVDTDEFFQTFKGNRSSIASIATMMFRYYGIPARYVEGYQIIPEDVAKMKPGKYLTVKGDRWHCWTEIYVDGFGWVPLEVNPEFKERMKQADLSIGIENTDLVNSFKPYNHREEFTFDNKEVIKEKSRESKGLWIYLIGLISAIIVISLISLIISLICRTIKRNKLFHSQDIKLAITAIYQELKNRKITLKEQVVRLGEEAAYSNHEFSENQRAFMLNEWKMKRHRMRKKSYHE
ncbi:transglutaminase-like domain-containing protein [Eubacteriales bacterium KG125]